ncbi:hypothetical protein GHT06_009214 [Daphnia sinensis]|uniref:Uncharacterized protein n=1 Tax=Daphnia sinensis TaxID=1820382 RepID=A0AAD5LMG8_9CRUS|nr:hypothetical protein GHT06_009214 [Daphnia sinensis]
MAFISESTIRIWMIIYNTNKMGMIVSMQIGGADGGIVIISEFLLRIKMNSEDKKKKMKTGKCSRNALFN